MNVHEILDSIYIYDKMTSIARKCKKEFKGSTSH